MDTRDNIKKVVTQLISGSSPFISDQEGVKEAHKLMGDLFDYGDDIADIAILAEKELSIKISLKSWKNIHTVGEMIDLLLEYS